MRNLVFHLLSFLYLSIAWVYYYPMEGESTAPQGCKGQAVLNSPLNTLSWEIVMPRAKGPVPKDGSVNQADEDAQLNVMTPWSRACPSRIQVSPSDPILLPPTFCHRGDQLGLSLSFGAHSAGQRAPFSGGLTNP